MRFLALFAVVAFSALISAPAYAGTSDDGWATCISRTVSLSGRNWLKLPKAGHQTWTKFVIYDRNFAKGPTKELSSNDEFRSEFLALRLEAACKAEMQGSSGQKPKFNANAVRSSLAKMDSRSDTGDMVEPETHVCVVYKDNLIRTLTMDVGSSEQVHLKDPNSSLRCFVVMNDGNLKEQFPAAITEAGK